jgi:hypothetical protein
MPMMSGPMMPMGGAMMGGAMGQMMPMMGGGMTGGGMMCGGMMSDHTEGRLAFLKTELKITDAQLPQWNRVAEALRATGSTMTGMHQQMMQGGWPATLPARLDLREKMLAAHLDALKGMKAALAPLYAAFSDEQKKIADDLMTCPMGMM